jgi:hypothetical protein
VAVRTHALVGRLSAHTLDELDALVEPEHLRYEFFAKGMLRP